MRLEDIVTGEWGEIQWAVAGRPYPGERASGDRHVVRPVAGGLLVAVVDGLGHGEEAAEAADLATWHFARERFDSLPGLFARVHDALRRTRGAVAAVAQFTPDSCRLAWAGIGNIEGCLLRAGGESDASGLADGREHLLCQGGVLGSEPLPSIRVRVLGVRPGDMVVLATDGIESAFIEAIDPSIPPAVLTGRILERFARPNDDALIFAARFREAAP